MSDIFCANCGLAYAAYRVMLLWNNVDLADECREGCDHTWSRMREDGLAEIYLNNDPECGELESGVS